MRPRLVLWLAVLASAAHALMLGLCLAPALPSLAQTSLGLAGLILSTAWLSLAHELAHYGAAQALRVSDLQLELPRFVVSYSEPSRPIKVMLISAAGPAVGVGYGWSGLWLLAHSHVGQAAVTWLTLTFVVSLVQGLFLLPFSGDGLAFWRSAWKLIKGDRLYEAK